jgi:hypothetical protein
MIEPATIALSTCALAIRLDPLSNQGLPEAAFARRA